MPHQRRSPSRTKVQTDPEHRGRPVPSGAHCRGAGAQAGMMIVQESCTILQISKDIADKVGKDAMVAETIGEDVMDPIDRSAPESGARGARAGRDELAERVGRAVREEGTFDLPGASACSARPRPPS